MNQYLVIGGSIIMAILGIWLNRKLTRANEDRIRAEIDEQTSKDLQGGLKNAYARQKAHDAAVSEVLSSPISDERASNLLSFPLATGKIPPTALSGNSGGKG